MRLLVVFAALLACGCGRLAFDGTTDAGRDPDARPCTPVGHDEDGDGVDDACDVCPHVAGSQLDADGDGVGDDCDPGPTPQQWVLFDPFTGMNADWDYWNGSSVAGDVLRIPAIAGAAGATLTAPPDRGIYETAGRVGAGGSGQRQISIQFGSPTGAYYCELFADPAQELSLMITHTPDGVAFLNLDTATIGGPLENGTFRITVTHAPPETIGCAAEWNGTRATVSAAIPGGIAPGTTDIGMYDLDGDLDYFVRLATP